MMPAMLLKLVLPKVTEMLLKQFKLDKIQEYVEGENELDREGKKLKTKINKLETLCQILVKKAKKD